MTHPLLAEVDHRSWPLPTGPWTMTQRWHDLLFAHWPIPVATLRALVPPTLQLDTFEGVAWISVVPFRMSGIRPRWLPALPWLSAFPELNLRTYVRGPDGARPGVFFFSLDAANPVAVRIARTVFRLPYFNAQMTMKQDGAVFDYASVRTHRAAPAAEFQGRYGPTGPVYQAEANTLEHWLTERYCLYAVDGAGRCYRADIHHRPWPLQPAGAEIVRNNLAEAAGMSLPQQAPALQFVSVLEVLVWPLRRVA